MDDVKITCINDAEDHVQLDRVGSDRLFITTQNENEGVPVMLNAETARQLAESLINWVNEQ